MLLKIVEQDTHSQSQYESAVIKTKIKNINAIQYLDSIRHLKINNLSMGAM